MNKRPRESHKRHPAFNPVTNEANSQGVGRRTKYGYDALDRLTSITLPNSGSAFLTFGYDDANNRTNVTDALGHSTLFGYDALGRLTAVTNALTKVWSFAVDAEGRRTLAIDPNAHTNSFVYDAVGQLTGWTNALTQVTAFGYDKLGNLTSVTDPRSNPLGFGYDAVSRLTNVTYAGGSIETFVYDPVGNISQMVTRAGQTIALTYDAANRLTQKGYVGGSDVISFSYDNANQLTGVVWTAGAANSGLGIGYDGAGRLTNETQTVGPASALAVGYQYYADGQRQKLIYPDGTFVTYDYNTNGWLTAIRDGGTNAIVTYGYDTAGRRTQRTLENNTFTVYGYDAADQLTNVWHQGVAGGITNLISQYQYGYNGAGNRSWVKRAQQSNKGDVYTYDSADQLTDVKYDATNPDGTPSGWDREVTYFYDAAGNRTGMVEQVGNATNTTSYAANSDNQLTNTAATRQGLTVTGFVQPGASSNKWNSSTAASRGVSAAVSSTNGTFSLPGVPLTAGPNALTVTVTDVSGNIGTQIVSVTVATNATALGYDANGDQTNDAVWSYTYDRENRLVSASNATTVVNYRYDALGRLIERRTSGGSVTTNRLYYAGWQLVAEYNGAGALQRKYVYGPGIDEPLRMTAGGTNYYFHADGLGSVSQISDVTGVTVEQYTYDVYGTPTFYNAGGAVTNASQIANLLLFTGRDRDQDTGWYNYRHRNYNPGLGRFVQPDPIRTKGGDANLYRYVGGCPASRIDPLGLADCAMLKAVIARLTRSSRDAIQSMSDNNQLFEDATTSADISLAISFAFASRTVVGLADDLAVNATKTAPTFVSATKGTVPVGVFTASGKVALVGSDAFRSAFVTAASARTIGATVIGAKAAASEVAQDLPSEFFVGAQRIFDPFGRLADVQIETGDEISASSFETILDLQEALRRIKDQYGKNCNCK